MTREKRISYTQGATTQLPRFSGAFSSHLALSVLKLNSYRRVTGGLKTEITLTHCASIRHVGLMPGGPWRARRGAEAAGPGGQALPIHLRFCSSSVPGASWHSGLPHE